ncbi:MAG: fibronectin type III domain-containing protein [Deltaproteobacteria bacterium]|nr:fibronectin type III domain-containing protein [Deltaproteobacteria bacterium]MBW2417911.1 fibronectin type III domain-containing protein [Deltaproteobacteria bacterium]
MECTNTSHRKIMGPLCARRKLGACLLLLLLAMLAPLLPADAEAGALERDTTLRFLPPSGSEVDGYRVYVTEETTESMEAIDIGLVLPDDEGIAHAVVALDAQFSYWVHVTAYNSAGESFPSNQIRIGAESCDPSLCDDSNPCTADSCDPLGCFSIPLPDESVCDDGYVDTVDDRCLAGVCEGIELACTSDLACDDGNLCNGAEVCDRGDICLDGEPLDCGAPTQCADPVCEAQLGCVWASRPDGTSCDDGDPDTLGDRCAVGVCQSGDGPELAIFEVVPGTVTPGRHTIEIRGTGLSTGMTLRFAKEGGGGGRGGGRSVRVRSLLFIDASTLEAKIEVSTRGARRNRYLDAILTAPDGSRVRLPRALRVSR